MLRRSLFLLEGNSRRLVDLLKQTTPDSQKKEVETKSKIEHFLQESGCDTRFLTNRFVIAPKSMALLDEDDGTGQALQTHKMFAVYKPPFCPMRREDAIENFHKVSVEGFVDHALCSQKVLPVIRGMQQLKKTSPDAKETPPLTVRVLNELELYSSGPVVIAMNQPSFVGSLRGAELGYDVLVYDHLLRAKRQTQPIPMDMLYSDEELVGSMPETRAESQLVADGYYGPHPASLMRVTIFSPPSARPPALNAYAEQLLGTFIVGDPTKPTLDYKKSTTMVPPRGDADFSRVFEHLSTISLLVKDGSAGGEAGKDAKISFTCHSMFQNLLAESHRSTGGKRSVTAFDGMWTPLQQQHFQAGMQISAQKKVMKNWR